ncbi:MAG: hypothetical protein HRU18_27385 [Pseudoalteromonas sp.]|nr:hypothetical protein [Legionellales bacterium]NRA81936.1 hypothetical protein [Pseudoalteromonas sp.]
MITSFTETEEFKELNEIFQELYQDEEYEDAYDVFLEIHQGITDFNSNLPDWYKIRWSMEPASDEVFEDALNEYNRNIYGWA